MQPAAGTLYKIPTSASRASPTPSFQAFNAQTFDFFDLLNANNNRDWFNEHRRDYERQVLQPALDFIIAMAPVLAKISTRFDAIPIRQCGSLMRAYRDTRFAMDQTPYKTNIGVQFSAFCR